MSHAPSSRTSSRAELDVRRRVGRAVRVRLPERERPPGRGHGRTAERDAGQLRCGERTEVRRRRTAGRVPTWRRAERSHLGHRHIGFGSARAGCRPTRARPLGMARGRRLRAQAQRDRGGTHRPRPCRRCRAGRRDVAGRTDRDAAGGRGTGLGWRTGHGRRHPVSTGTPRRDDRRTEGHGRAGPGRP